MSGGLEPEGGWGDVFRYGLLLLFGTLVVIIGLGNREHTLLYLLALYLVGGAVALVVVLLRRRRRT